MALSLHPHPDGHHRCSWCGQGEAFTDYINYHDHEWGMPVEDDRRLFEKITLEGFQAGLSWITVLRKRDHFRKVFKNFNFEKVARFNQKDVDHLVLDAGIIRHRGKIESAINNAQKVCDLIEREGEGALARLVWAHEPSAKDRPRHITPKAAMALTQTAQSQDLSTTLRKMGFNFVGPTTMYALMQSMGVVNDHLEGCAHRAQVEQARQLFQRPG
jgi:DNA-3-methyladenine glycosylase I